MRESCLIHALSNAGSSQHIALAINEEVDLQARLLDDLHDDVEVTQTRMRAATARVGVWAEKGLHVGALCILLVSKQDVHAGLRPGWVTLCVSEKSGTLAVHASTSCAMRARVCV